MTTVPPLNIIDFHNHYVSPQFEVTAAKNGACGQQQLWNSIGGKISDLRSVLRGIEDGGIDGRVINTPPALIGDPAGNIPAEWPARINDGLADVIAKHPGRLHGLATIDAWGGEAAGREVRRAVKTLGLRGVFVESAKGDRLLDAPEARPALSAAAELGVPVFVHPVNPKALTKQLGGYGRLGTSLARGTVNSAALYSLLAGGVFDELPNLHVVVTTLAVGGILLAGAFGDGAWIRRDAPVEKRRHVYVDTMGLSPVLIRAAVDLIGADHVLYGTDWPIYDDGPVRGRLTLALTAAGLDQDQRRQIAGGNTLRLLGIPEGYAGLRPAPALVP